MNHGRNKSLGPGWRLGLGDFEQRLLERFWKELDREAQSIFGAQVAAIQGTYIPYSAGAEAYFWYGPGDDGLPWLRKGAFPETNVFTCLGTASYTNMRRGTNRTAFLWLHHGTIRMLDYGGPAPDTKKAQEWPVNACLVLSDPMSYVPLAMESVPPCAPTHGEPQGLGSWSEMFDCWSFREPPSIDRREWLLPGNPQAYPDDFMTLLSAANGFRIGTHTVILGADQVYTKEITYGLNLTVIAEVASYLLIGIECRKPRAGVCVVSQRYERIAGPFESLADAIDQGHAYLRTLDWHSSRWVNCPRGRK